MKKLRKYTLFFSFLSGIAGDVLAINLGNCGHSWQIVEEGIITMIKRKLATLDLSEAQAQVTEKAKRNFEKMKNLGLPQATTTREYFFDPTYVLNKDIVGANGAIIFPAGTKVNPLESGPLDEKLLIIDGEQTSNIALAKKLITADKNTKYRIVLVGGSPTKVAKELGKEVFHDQIRELVKRFKLSRVPALIEQEGLMLKITEVPAE